MLKIRKILETWKVYKGRQFRKTFTKTPTFCQFDTKNLGFYKTFDSFSSFFVRPKSFFNTMFGAIIIKTKLIKLLMLCHIFSPKEPR